jgi:hypothetical protein
MYTLKKAVLLFTILLIQAACSSKNDIEPVVLNGRYDLKNVSSEITFKLGQPELNNQDLADKGIYFEFGRDGNYTTNAEFSLKKIEKSQNISTNAYEIDGKKLILTIIEADLNVPFKLYLNIQEDNGQLKLTLNQQDLLKSFEASISGMNALTSSLVQALVNNIADFQYTLELTKEAQV